MPELQPDEPAPLDRAERLVAAWERRLGDVVRRLLARTTEEAEDVWAEVQERRQTRRQERDTPS
jgi:hypothetical protein